MIFEDVSWFRTKEIYFITSFFRRHWRWDDCNACKYWSGYRNYYAFFLASNYLELLAIVSGAYYLIRGAISSKDDENKGFAQSKKDMAVFFSSQILTNTAGLSRTICLENSELDSKRINNILGDF